MTPDITHTNLLLQVRNLSKSFPGVQALDGVRFELARGEVHALVGENGAGKSTLMKILAGLEQPDAGEIVFNGRAVRLRNPHHALRLGISMIHQELLPFPDLTVAENIFMGRQPARWLPGWIDRRRMNADARRLLEQFGARIEPTRTLRELSVAEMQTVEIAKALAHRTAVLILDEPTSALSAHESKRLFQMIDDLRRHGVALIYVSHKLDEVLRLADTVTVLRDGRHVATQPAREVNTDRLIALMVGRELNAAVRPAPDARPAEVVLSVRGLRKAGRFRDVSFEVRRGEVVGLAGLMGAGRTDVACALYGLAPADSGEVRVHGRPVRIARPRDALRHGIGFVSEDRQVFGLVPMMGIKPNVTLAALRTCCRAGFIQAAAENRVADESIRALGIKAAHRDQPVRELSGGNQQKVVLARALLTEPRILILDEPTRGMDIGAKAEVHALIARLAREGKAVLLISSELPELLALCDRILVMRNGTITAELDPRRATPEEVLKHAVPS